MLKQLLIVKNKNTLFTLQTVNVLARSYSFSFKLLGDTIARFVSQLLVLMGMSGDMLKGGGCVKPQAEIGRGWNA